MSARLWVGLLGFTIACSAAPDAKREPRAPQSSETLGTEPDGSDGGIQIGAEGAPPNCGSDYQLLDYLPPGATHTGREIVDALPDGFEGMFQLVDGRPRALRIDLLHPDEPRGTYFDDCRGVYHHEVDAVLTTAAFAHDTLAVFEGPNPDEMHLLVFMFPEAIDGVHVVGDLTSTGTWSGDITEGWDGSGTDFGAWTVRSVWSSPY